MRYALYLDQLIEIRKRPLSLIKLSDNKCNYLIGYLLVIDFTVVYPLLDFFFLMSYHSLIYFLCFTKSYDVGAQF